MQALINQQVSMSRVGSCMFLSLALVYCCVISMLSNHFNLFLSDVEVKELGEEGGGGGTQGGRRRITTRIMIGGEDVP